MVFQAPLRRFLLLLSPERFVNTPRTPLQHTEFLGSHSRCEGSKLERAAGDGRRGALEQYEVAAREFQKGLWSQTVTKVDSIQRLRCSSDEGHRILEC